VLDQDDALALLAPGHRERGHLTRLEARSQPDAELLANRDIVAPVLREHAETGTSRERAVAAEAGVPLASTTRYFESLAGGGDQGLEDALMALWAAATRAIGTR